MVVTRRTPVVPPPQPVAARNPSGRRAQPPSRPSFSNDMASASKDADPRMGAASPTGSSNGNKDHNTALDASSGKKSKRSRRRGKNKGQKSNFEAFLDFLTKLLLLAFTIYTFTVCSQDTHPQSPICRGLTEYRRIVLDPYIIPPIQAALNHPSLAPHIERAQPYVHRAVEIASPILARTQQQWNIYVVPQFEKRFIPAWNKRVVPQWNKYIVPQWEKYLAPQIQRAQSAMDPYRLRLVQEYEQRIVPRFHVAIHNLQRWQRQAEPYVVLAVSKTKDGYQVAKPYAIPLAKKFGHILQQFAFFLRGQRQKFVDPHVAKMWAKIKELSSGKQETSEPASERESVASNTLMTNLEAQEYETVVWSTYPYTPTYDATPTASNDPDVAHGSPSLSASETTEMRSHSRSAETGTPSNSGPVTSTQIANLPGMICGTAACNFLEVASSDLVSSSATPSGTFLPDPLTSIQFDEPYEIPVSTDAPRTTLSPDTRPGTPTPKAAPSLEAPLPDALPTSLHSTDIKIPGMICGTAGCHAKIPEVTQSSEAYPVTSATLIHSTDIKIPGMICGTAGCRGLEEALKSTSSASVIASVTQSTMAFPAASAAVPLTNRHAGDEEPAFQDLPIGCGTGKVCPPIATEIAVPAASASTPLNPRDDGEIDFDAFYAELGLDEPEKLGGTTPSLPAESEEERAERLRRKVEETARKRADIEARQAKWEAELEVQMARSTSQLQSRLRDLRAAAATELATSVEVRSSIEELVSEAEKYLKGAEIYLKNLKGEARRTDEKLALWDRVADRINDKFNERLSATEGGINGWYKIILDKELQEVTAVAAEVREVAEKGQLDLGLDYAWLEDVTFNDWQRYHALIGASEQFANKAASIQNGTHSKIVVINPITLIFEDLESEVRDVVIGFETRLRRIKREGERAFNNHGNGISQKEEDKGSSVEPEGEPEPKFSILPVPRDGSIRERQQAFVPPVVIGRSQEEVLEALGKVEPVGLARGSNVDPEEAVSRLVQEAEARHTEL